MLNLAKVETKFQNGLALNTQDSNLLRNLIASSSDIDVLCTSIRIFSYSFEYDKNIEMLISRYIIDEPAPGLTAICIEALMSHWVPSKKYKSYVEKYVDYDLYKKRIWDQECIISTNIVLSEPEIFDDKSIKLAKSFVDGVVSDGDVDLLSSFPEWKKLLN